MRTCILICLTQIWMTFPILAQNNGLELDDESYEQVPLWPLPDRRGEEPEMVSLRAYSPTPGDQGQMASCVAWALANAMTVNKAVMLDRMGREDVDPISHSSAYIYNQLRWEGDCQRGIKFSAALSLLKEKGDCLVEDFSPPNHSCEEQPSSTHHIKAAPFRIAGYKKLTTRDYPLEDRIHVIRDALMKNRPVVIGMFVPEGLRTLPSSELDWESPKEGHAMLVIGYNDERFEFELMNSYGDRWEDQGFLYLDYDLLARNLWYSYVIVLGDDFGR